MEAANKRVENLIEQISATEKELERLKLQLAEAERLKKDLHTAQAAELTQNAANTYAARRWPLSPEEYVRYGRQMIVPSIGIEGQLRIRAASVLIVGAGGLGCPAAVYIAGAGVKSLGIVDGDTVEVSNLHRQTLHSTENVGLWKVDSAIQSLKRLNPDIEYKGFREHLTPENALDIVSQYDLVLDCTDNPRPRYIISDACVLLHKALISASALQTDGQLMVLNSPPRPQGSTGSPCYRCVFPKPPPADSIVSCGEGGILGPVVGTMGVLQALEAIKMIAKGLPLDDSSVSEFDESKVLSPPMMLLLSANCSPPFRSIKLRSRRPDCFACSAKAGLSRESMTSGSLDYVAFCGLASPVKLLSPEERISAKEYAKIHGRVGKDHVLIDTREKVHFDIANIEGSTNLPLSRVHNLQMDGAESWLPSSLPEDAPIYVVCRLGNDSQVVTKKLKECGLDLQGKRYIADIEGGLRAWKEQVDHSWPDY